MATVDISDLTNHQAIRDILATLVPLTASAVYNAGSIADGDEAAVETVVTGAALGDFVLVSLEVDLADLVLSASVTATDTVTSVLANNTGGAVDLASTTLRIRVLPFGNVLTA